MATTVKQLALALEALTARVAELEAARQGPSEAYRASTYAECTTPEARAAYLRDFRRRKAAAKDKAALKAPAPGESPTAMEFGRRLVADTAEALGVPVTELTFRGGCVYHRGQQVA